LSIANTKQFLIVMTTFEPQGNGRIKPIDGCLTMALHDDASKPTETHRQIHSRKDWLTLRKTLDDTFPKLILSHVHGHLSGEIIGILSAMRDLDSAPVCMRGSKGPLVAEQVEQVRGLGFMADSGDQGYCFDIDHYKTTPDWLNPRHWANPELWDKYRW